MNKSAHRRPQWIKLLFYSLNLLYILLELGSPVTGQTFGEETTDFSQFRRIRGRVLKEETFLAPSDNVRLRKRTKRHVPILDTIHPDGGHLERLRLEVPLDSTNHILDLQLNRDLIPDGYFERVQQGLKPVVQKPSYKDADLCHYRGKINNRPDSWAALSTCDGIRGIIYDGKETHYLEPPMEIPELLGRSGSSKSRNNSGSVGDDESSKSITNGEETDWEILHYKQSHLTRNFSCGHGPADVMPGFGLANLIKMGRKDTDDKSQRRYKRGASDHADTRMPYNSNGKSRYVELVVVVDNKKYKDLGEDLKRTLRRTKDIVNIVNALYQPFNVFIALMGVVVWTEMDEMKITGNGDATLQAFLHYRKERLVKDHPNDNAQLLTAQEFENGVVGKAMQGPICSYKYSGGVNSDFRNNLVGIVATTVAHELGHNFGLAHDQEGECQCSAPGNRCIMAASASSNQTSQWSSCSLKDMAYAFDHGMDYCLRNKPKSLFDGPTCGNGFTEPGEECDCGLTEHCQNPCCDASTCLIHANATCASGTCCDMNTCHVKAGGSPCRETAGLCDLPEFCTGESEFCPEDVHKLDGLNCKTPTGEAYCYNGECRTHSDQCKLLWGPSGNNSDDLCYQRNANGTKVAHCGFDMVTEKYSRCKIEDTKCGILHCQMNAEKLEFGYENAALLSSFFVNSRGKVYACRSVTVDFGLRDINPGMVPDGAKCGDDKMCISQKCVSVKDVLGSYASSCGDCSGHGVCNSKGHCHCEDGYGGHVCEGAGAGGSIDSGPAYHQGTSRLAKAFYVTFFGFIPLIAIISFYFYYANDSLKKLCLEIRRGGLAAVAQPPGRGPKPPPPPSSLGNGRIGGRSSANSGGSRVTSPTQQQIGEDFFGNYKGFSLSPIKSSPQLQRNGSANPGPGSPPTRGTMNSRNNNNNTITNSVTTTATTASSSSPTTAQNIPNGHAVQSRTNENVYYSPAARVVEHTTLVKNSADKPTTLKNSQKDSFLQRGMARVSWAQPIASRLPVSPPSEDESANSDTPLYETSDGGSPTITAGSNRSGQESQGQYQPKPRPLSSPDAYQEMKTLEGVEKPSSSSMASRFGNFAGGSTSALSRLANAIPFMRNSLRGTSAQEDNQQRHSKHFPKNVRREDLVISSPTLLSDIDQQKIEKCVPITPQEEQCPKEPRYANISSSQENISSTATSNPKTGGRFSSSPINRYANVPSPASQPAVGVKPSGKNLQRVKDTTPPPEPVQKPIPKVQRAHSMIQPSSNRNSLTGVGNNPNYNSLRRSRPTAPPPKPPETSPPPPPVASFVPRSNFFKSSTPPPYNSSAAAVAATTSPSSVRASIMKFTFGGGRTPGGFFNSRFGAGDSKGQSISKQSEDVSSPPTELPPSPPPLVTRKEDNIYDTIDEGIPPINFEKKAELASSEESSPKKETTASLEERIDTLSTGSSENGGGLLGEIISEINYRNKESIYNSIDRKRMKAKKKAAALAAAEKAEKEAANRGPSSRLLSSTPPSLTSRGSSSSSPAPNTSPSSAPELKKSPKFSRSYDPPKSFGVSSYSSGRNSSSPQSQDSYRSKSPLAEKPKIPYTSGLSRLSSSMLGGRPLSSPGSSSSTPSARPTLERGVTPPPAISPKSISSECNPVVTPPKPGTPAASASTLNSVVKPTCAVNGIPKATTSPPLPPVPVLTPPQCQSSPSYVAKINYFSNLTSAAANTPMKPINSIPAPSPGNHANEIIYAPSSVLGMGNSRDGDKHLSTIRRSRPSYLRNQDSIVVNEDESNCNKDSRGRPSSTDSSNSGPFVKKPGGGIYASLGRKVPAPVIRSNSIEKEKLESTKLIMNNSSREPSPTQNTKTAMEVPPTTEDKITNDLIKNGGYKPFNPYLNRPLTFSTFRPNNTNTNGNTNHVSTNGPSPNVNSSTMKSTNSQKPITLSTYPIVSNNKTASKNGGMAVAVTSPVQIRANRS